MLYGYCRNTTFIYNLFCTHCEGMSIWCIYTRLDIGLDIHTYGKTMLFNNCSCFMFQKYNTVIAMKNRVTHISDPSLLRFNLRRLFVLFANKGYPKRILNKLSQ